MSCVLQQQIHALQEIRNSQRDIFNQEAIQTIKSSNSKHADLIVTTVDGKGSPRTTVSKNQSTCIGVSKLGLNCNSYSSNS